MHYHPWRSLREMGGWTFLVAHLPAGILGLTDHRTRTIVLAPGQTQRQRRCTIAHEVAHAERPPFPAEHSAAEERAVNAIAARRLIPFPALARGLQWTRDHRELAEELWVDEDTLRVRLAHLHPSERTKLKEILSDDH